MARKSPALASVLVALLVISPSLARADGAASPAGLAHFTAGRAAYRDAKLDLAAREFQAAYDLDHLAELLYDVARSRHDQYLLAPDAATLQLAIAAYRRYVAEAPNGKYRKESIQALDALVYVASRQIEPAPPPKPPLDDDEPTPPPPPVMAPPPPIDPYIVKAPAPRRWVTPVVVVASVAVVGLALGLGLGLGLHGSSDGGSLGKVATPW